MDEALRQDAERRIPKARIHLSQADLEHGDRIEIIISSRLTEADRRRTQTQSDAAAGAEQEMTEFVVRRIFRVADIGWSSSINPQFVLVAPDMRAQFIPVPGVAAEFRYRCRAEWTDWLLPSASISVHALTTPLPETAAADPEGAEGSEATPSASIGLGAAAGLGLLNGLVHAGVGVRVDGDLDRYVFVAFDFANGVGVFAQTQTGGYDPD